MRRACFTFVLLFGGTSQTFSADLRENEILIGGGSSESCGFGVSGLNLAVRRDQPAIAFGFVKVPGGVPDYSYMLMIKGDEKRRTLAHFETRSTSNGSEVRDEGAVEISGNRIAFVYTMKIDPTGKEAPRETLTLNGKDVNLKNGRVALVDLSGKQITWSQVDVKLPAGPIAPRATDDVDKLSRENIKHLKKTDTVREFLK